MENKNEDLVNEIIETEQTISEVSIKNVSTYSKEGYMQMNGEIAKKNLSLMIVMELILVGIDAFLYVNYKTMLLYAIVVSAFIVAYPFLIKLMAKIQLEKTFKMYNNVFDSAKYEFTFMDKSFRIDLTTKDTSKNSVLAYSKLYEVIENDKYLFIFISSNQSYIVDKKGFENQEDIEKLIEIFKNNNLKCKRSKSKK